MSNWAEKQWICLVRRLTGLPRRHPIRRGRHAAVAAQVLRSSSGPSSPQQYRLSTRAKAMVRGGNSGTYWAPRQVRRAKIWGSCGAI